MTKDEAEGPGHIQSCGGFGIYSKRMGIWMDVIYLFGHSFIEI